MVRYRGLNTTAKFLWARLARYGSETGDVYPSIRTLAAELGLSDRQVQRGVASLERERFIQRVLRRSPRGDYTSTEYVFLLHPILLEALAARVSAERCKQTGQEWVVTQMSPGGEPSVTTKIKRRLEEKTSSSATSVPTPPSPTPSQKSKGDDDPVPSCEKAELRDLIHQFTGQAPDRRLSRDISEMLELRGVSLRDYLDDIRPRLTRLTRPPGPGFFHNHARSWSESRPATAPVRAAQAREAESRCRQCNGTGRTADGYCTCSMGRDLSAVERRVARKQLENPA